MKKILFAVALLIAICGKAKASTDVNVVGSSWTYSGVQCTTGTPVEVDNWLAGTQLSTYSVSSSSNFVNSNRISITLQNQDPTYSVWLGFDSSVATQTATAAGKNYLGQRLLAGDQVTKGTLKATKTWCQAADGAGAGGVYLHLESIAKE